MMRFAVISDIHLGPRGYLRGVPQKLGEHAELLLANFVERMNSEVMPEFVVQLGDAIEDAGHDRDRENYARVIGLLGGLSCPVYHAIGNHDRVNLAEDEVLGLIGRKPYYSFLCGEYRGIVLCPHEADGKPCVIDDRQLSWLERELMRDERRALVFSHVPLADQPLAGNVWFEHAPDYALMSNRAAVRKVLEDSGNVVGAMNGHTHWNRMDVHNAIPYFTLHSLVERLDEETPTGSYGVVDVDGESIRMRVAGRAPGEFVFSNSRGP